MEVESLRINICGLCSSKNLKSIFNFGLQPLANSLNLESSPKVERTFELNLLICTECFLVQLSEKVNPNLMFSEYSWITGTSDSTKRHCEKLAKQILNYKPLKRKKILEIGSNDATFLYNFINSQAELILGVDPANNFTTFYKPPLEFFNTFFTEASAKEILAKYGHFDVIVARNVFSHIPDAREVFRAVSILLAKNGIFYIEFHWLKVILNELHYDSIYHEHTYYHSINSISRFLSEFGLQPFEVWESPISGGSLILSVSKENQDSSNNLHIYNDLEKESGICDLESWNKFSFKIEQNISEAREYLERNNDKKIYGFGVSARSSTIMNAIGTSSNYLKGIADNNKLKWGKYTPGVHLPIMSPKKAVGYKPDIFMIFPFNFELEIIDQLKQLGWSGEVVLPLPKKLRTFTI